LRIQVVDHVAGAAAARGIAVIVDVFRAFTVAPHAFAAGATRVLPAGAIEEALALKVAIPDALLIGERHARRLPGFDAGNSPTEVVAMNPAGRTLIHTTHAGTQGLVNARLADEVLTGSFVNVSAIARYIQQQAPPDVTIVRMGHEARQRCAEDDLCAAVLVDLMQGGAAPATASVRAQLRTAPAAVKFFDPACDWAPLTDFDYCTEVDRFDFVLRVRRDAQGRLDLERVELANHQ
jgi:2-phosphosulfolactate phosphatase